MLQKIQRQELLQAQIALFVAIALQFVVWAINKQANDLQITIILAEVVLAVLIGFTANTRSLREKGIHNLASVTLLVLISLANISALATVLNDLIVSHAVFRGEELLSSAIAILLTNIIVFSLLYWEIDSPGLTKKKWSRHDKDFQFTQHDIRSDYNSWQPQYLDYLYLSITNALNFASADARPLTHQAKILMAIQALISITTLALVIARSVSILG